MNARWDLFLPVLWVVAYATFWWVMGYVQGKKRTEAWHRLMSDVNRVKQAQEKQLYDWETHGL